MSDDLALLDKDCAAEPICPVCERNLEWMVCDQCDGAGVYGHGCGEDCCACLDPEYNEPCAECNGTGGWEWCATCAKEPA